MESQTQNTQNQEAQEEKDSWLLLFAMIGVITVAVGIVSLIFYTLNGGFSPRYTIKQEMSETGVYYEMDSVSVVRRNLVGDIIVTKEWKRDMKFGKNLVTRIYDREDGSFLAVEEFRVKWDEASICTERAKAQAWIDEQERINELLTNSCD